jgi:hypothetical protein
VIVQDTTPPVAVLSGAAFIQILQGDVYNDAGATATDSIASSPSITTSGYPFDTNVVGKRTISYIAIDASGNQASPVTRVVQVLDLAVEAYAQEVAYGAYQTSLQLSGGDTSLAESDAYSAYVAAGGQKLRSSFNPIPEETNSESSGSASSPIIIIIVVIVGAVLFVVITIVLITQKRRHDRQIRRDEAMYAKVAEALGPEAVRQWNENFAKKNKKISGGANGIYGLAGVHGSSSSSDGPVYQQPFEEDEEFSRIVNTLKAAAPTFGLNGKPLPAHSAALTMNQRFLAQPMQSNTMSSHSRLGDDDVDGYMAPTATLKPGAHLSLDAAGYMAPTATLKPGAHMSFDAAGYVAPGDGPELQNDYVVPTATLNPRTSVISFDHVAESNDDDEFAAGHYVAPFGNSYLDYAEPEEQVGYEVYVSLFCFSCLLTFSKDIDGEESVHDGLVYVSPDAAPQVKFNESLVYAEPSAMESKSIGDQQQAGFVVPNAPLVYQDPMASNTVVAKQSLVYADPDQGAAHHEEAQEEANYGFLSGNNAASKYQQVLELLVRTKIKWYQPDATRQEVSFQPLHSSPLPANRLPKRWPPSLRARFLSARARKLAALPCRSSATTHRSRRGTGSLPSSLIVCV